MAGKNTRAPAAPARPAVRTRGFNPNAALESTLAPAGAQSGPTPVVGVAAPAAPLVLAAAPESPGVQEPTVPAPRPTTPEPAAAAAPKTEPEPEPEVPSALEPLLAGDHSWPGALAPGADVEIELADFITGAEHPVEFAEAVQSAARGVADVKGGVLSYVAPDDSGEDVVVFTVTDAAGRTATGSILFDVSPASRESSSPRTTPSATTAGSGKKAAAKKQPSRRTPPRHIPEREEQAGGTRTQARVTSYLPDKMHQTIRRYRIQMAGEMPEVTSYPPGAVLAEALIAYGDLGRLAFEACKREDPPEPAPGQIIAMPRLRTQPVTAWNVTPSPGTRQALHMASSAFAADNGVEVSHSMMVRVALEAFFPSWEEGSCARDVPSSE